MRYEVDGKDIILYERDLDLDQTLDCGQAFRWYRENGVYRGYCVDTPLEISGADGVFRLKDTSEREFSEVWKDYFDLDTDYSQIKAKYSSDETLRAACEFSSGIRLLRQDAWEALVSYIFSQHNNIPRIKGIIERLVTHYGHFPNAEELAAETCESLGYLRCGFRARYVIDAAKKVASGEVSLERCRSLDYEDAKAELMKITGVGPKVADCVLLYGMNFTEAFPIDVWMRRVMSTFYPNGLPECTNGTQGIAQLYLFNYIRHLEQSREDSCAAQK